MSGPKADAILAHSGVEKKKKRKRTKNEDYMGGTASGSKGDGLVMKDEDVRWGRKDEDEDGDAPGA
jgi:pre-mRNA-splicing factor CWC26